MRDDRPKPLNYPSPKRHRAYERNGWIGLAVTLAICALVAFLKFSSKTNP